VSTSAPQVRKRLYTLLEIETATGFSRSTIYAWHAAKRIKLVRVASRTFMTDEEFERLVAGEIDLPKGRRATQAVNKPTRPGRRRGRPRKQPPIAGE
jgi:hypothetical protein